ncbi:MAG: actinodefensin-associated protein B [Pseudonocardiaceae bacterium]
MTTTNTSPTMRGSLRLAPDVTLTRLPLGGAVLVDGISLTLAEFNESDTAVLALLLAGGEPAPKGDARVRRMAEELAVAGWLVPDGKPGA